MFWILFGKCRAHFYNWKICTLNYSYSSTCIWQYCPSIWISHKCKLWLLINVGDPNTKDFHELEVVPNVLLTDMKHAIHDLRLVGSITSTVSKSLEKRLTIRPMGVMSKKDIGLRKMLLSASLCKIFEAWIVAAAMIAEPAMMDVAVSSENICH